MTTQSFDPAATGVVVTEKAKKHFLRQLEKQQAQGVCIGVKKSGCTGYKIVLDFVQSAPDQAVRQNQSDFDLYITHQALAMVQGMEIDYVLEGVNQTLKFNNPNAKEYCGCGESFSVSN